MVVEQSMTVFDVVAGVRDGRLDDFVKEAVALFVRELMEAEITGEIGAGRGEIAPGSRASYRNGYRSRLWETRVGETWAADPAQALRGVVFPVVSRAQAPVGAGDRCCCDGGVCQRGLDPEG